MEPHQIASPHVEEDGEIALTETQFQEFYDNFGSNSFKLQGEVLGDLGSKQLDIYFRSIGFVTTVLGAIGIIAGFGFTAYGYVESLFLFFLGEALLLSSLFVGVFWTQEKYRAEFRELEEERRNHVTFYERRNTKFLEIYNSWIRNRKISKLALSELNEIDKSSLDLFKTDANRPIPSIYSPTMYRLMVVGTIVLLCSFLAHDLFWFLVAI